MLIPGSFELDGSAITSIVSDERNAKFVFKYMVIVDYVCLMDKVITAIHGLIGITCV